MVHEGKERRREPVARPIVLKCFCESVIVYDFEKKNLWQIILYKWCPLNKTLPPLTTLRVSKYIHHRLIK
jgi:hypothetical protein